MYILIKCESGLEIRLVNYVSPISLYEDFRFFQPGDEIMGETIKSMTIRETK